MELKQTMDMYGTACKEALVAKQKVWMITVYFNYVYVNGGCLS